MRFPPLLLICLLGALAGAPRPALAQTDQRASIEQAAAEYVATFIRQGNPARRVVLEQKAPKGRGLTAAARRGALQALRATDGSEDTLIVCGDSFRSCRMHGTDAIVSLDVGAVTDTTALVSVQIKEATGHPKMPLGIGWRTYHFAKRAGAWRFVRAGRRMVT
jgi:hypothetical protein